MAAAHAACRVGVPFGDGASWDGGGAAVCERRR
jgi:hypothetical protein